MRNSTCSSRSSEALYNLARGYHQLSLFKYALYGYHQALQVVDLIYATF